MTTRHRTTFTVRQDRRYIRPTAHSQRFLVARIDGAAGDRRAARPPVNLAIVLDRSGSMSGAKLDIAKRAVEEAIGRLGPDDRFSVVVYDDGSTSWSPSTPRPPTRGGRPSNGSARSTRAAARTSARAGCAAASRSRPT